MRVMVELVFTDAAPVYDVEGGATALEAAGYTVHFVADRLTLDEPLDDFLQVVSPEIEGPVDEIRAKVWREVVDIGGEYGGDYVDYGGVVEPGWRPFDNFGGPDPVGSEVADLMSRLEQRGADR